jgi:glutamyl-tRNA synthetase
MDGLFSGENVIVSNALANIRVRFAPSPTGYLHIGGARTVLFNWLVARRAGGSFILRIEDTDQQRHVEDSVRKILDDLQWLNLNWDEGPELQIDDQEDVQSRGDYGPYFQSRRLDMYNRYLQQLLESDHAYYAFETTEELAAMRESAKRDKRNVTYIRPDPVPTIEQGLEARRQGRPVVIRFKMPHEDITVIDDILGDVTLKADQVEDFVIQKSDGFPTYHFACVVDDELMNITHVLRGQEHLMNTPKHVALQRALGFTTPRYGHMPVIFNMDGSKMSKRDKEKALAKGEKPPEIDVHDFRVAGYLPEAVLNFIALLGWNPGDDREFFTLDELVQSFSIERVGKTNARFDRDKLLSFNLTWSTRLAEESDESRKRLLDAFCDFLTVNPDVPAALRDLAIASRGIDRVSRELQLARSTDPSRRLQPARSAEADDILAHVLRACAGFRTFADVIHKAGALFMPDDQIQFDEKAVKKVLAKNDNAGFRMLELLRPRLESLNDADWNAEAIEKLVADVCAEQQCGMGAVAQPLRVAVTGTTVSPAIGETLVLLGKDGTLSRVANCLARVEA